MTQCPPGRVVVNGICVVSASGTNGTTTITPEESSNTLVPAPFSIIAIGISICVLISKYIHSETVVSISVFALVSMLAVICDVFYMMRSLISPHGESVQLYTFILIVGILFSYINNIIYLFVTKHTLLKDESFIFWKRGNVKIIKEGKLEQPSHENL